MLYNEKRKESSSINRKRDEIEVQNNFYIFAILGNSHTYFPF